MADGDLDQKHLHVESRRRRFDAGSKWGGYAGASLVRPIAGRSWVDGYDDAFLKINRPVDQEGNILVTGLDQDLELAPALEVKVRGQPGQATMSGGKLFLLPQLLEEAAIAKKVTRDPTCPLIIVTSYELRGIGWVAQGEEEKQRLEKKREAKLTLARSQAGKVKVFCKFRDSPLESIPDPSLLDESAKMMSGGNFFLWYCNPRDASVFSESDTSCFCSDDDNAFLEVDLGTSCHVTYVSTQGRFPPIHKTDKDSGMRVINDGHPHLHNWVMSYELTCRADHGREWLPLGTFKGNSDMMSEVAHELEASLKSPVECRYLRFKPLAYHGRPAFRVGVYGYRLGKNPQKRQEESNSDDVVEYTICRVQPGANRRRVHGSRNPHRGGCARHSKYMIGCGCKDNAATAPFARRKRLLKGMVQEIRALDAYGTLPQAAAQEEEEEAKPVKPSKAGMVAEAKEGAATGGDAAFFAPPPRPALSRRRSFSDPDLSVQRPPSPPSDGSFAIVDERQGLEALAQLEDDDWVVMG